MQSEFSSLIQAFSAMANFIATCVLVWVTYMLVQVTREMSAATREMASANTAMQKIYEDIKTTSDKSIKIQSTVTIMQMLNSADSLVLQDHELLKMSEDAINDEILKYMLKEIDSNEDYAIRKVWITFIWLNTEQAHFFLKELSPEINFKHTERKYGKILGGMLEYRYVRYLVSSRGFYDMFIEHCKELYGKER